jgi:ribosomal protein S5
MGTNLVKKEFSSVSEAEQHVLQLKADLRDLQSQLDDPSRATHLSPYDYEGWRRRATVAFNARKAGLKAAQYWLKRNKVAGLAESLAATLKTREQTPAVKAAVDALEALISEARAKPEEEA